MKRRTLLTLIAASPAFTTLRLRAGNDMPALVQLIEQTPRDQLMAKVVALIRKGLGRGDLLWAIQLAGMRQIQPRPVGFKFHAVMMVDAARRLGEGASGLDGWVPILWNLDYFKFSQQRNLNQGGWQLAEFDGVMMSADQSLSQFELGLKTRDEQLVDAAAMAVTSQHGLNAVFEVLAHYAVRDFHSIGHKAIYLCHAWRMLQLAGGQQADWALRALAYALIADGDVAPQDKHWTRVDYSENLVRAKRIPVIAMREESDPLLSEQLVVQLREKSAEQCCEYAMEMLQKGSSQALWDGVFLAAAERVLQQPTIPMLHCVTVTHAMAWLWRHCADMENRRLLMLQAVTYLARMRSQRWAGRPTALTLASLQTDSHQRTADERLGLIAEAMDSDAEQRVAQFMAYPYEQAWPELQLQLLSWLRRKSNQAHDFKYGASVLETLHWLSPAQRPRYLAAASSLLPGPSRKDSGEAAQVQQWLG